MVRSARRSPWAARPRAAAAVGLLAPLLTLLPAVVTGGWGAPAALAAPVPAAASAVAEDVLVEDAQEGLRLVVDEVRPTVPRVGEPVSVRGRIVNDGPAQRRLTTVTARAMWTPLLARADVTSWLEGSDTRQAGWILGVDDVGPVVVPGASIPFRVEIPADTFLGLPTDLTALAVELEASGASDVWATQEQLEEEPVVTRTVLTAVRPAPVEDPLDVAWVVPLTLPADPGLTAPDDEDRHAAWLAATGPGSQARTWLENLSVPGVTWMVDPALLVPVERGRQLLPEQPEELEEPDDRPEDGPPGDPTGETSPGPTTSPDDDGTEEDAPRPSGTDDATVTTAAPPAGGGEGGAGVTGGDDASRTTTAPTDSLDDGQHLGGQPDAGPGPVDGEDVDTALATLRGLLARTPTAQLWWTPVGDPDVGALLRLDPAEVEAREVLGAPLGETTAQTERLLRRGRGDVAWPELAAVGEQDLATLDRFWASRSQTPGGLGAVVVPRESLSGGSNTFVGTAVRRVRQDESVVALGADTRGAALLAGLTEDSARLGEGAVTQRLLADSLTAYLQEPVASRSMVYAPPRGTAATAGVVAELSEAFEEAPWVNHVPAADLLEAAEDPALEPAPLTGVAPSAGVLGRALVDRVTPLPTPLGDRQVRNLTRLDDSLTGLGQVLAETSAVRAWEPLVAHLWSTRWRGQPDAWVRSMQDVRRPVQTTQEAVHVNPSTVNFLSDQGLMQLTVVNDLPVAVEGVRVEVVPERTLFRVLEQPEPISIGPGSRATVSFTAQAVTRGVTTVDARLTAPNGTELGDAAEVSVRVQPTGVWIYWVLGSIAGLVLVLGLLRSRRTAPRSAVVAASTGPSRRPAGAMPTIPEENR